MKKISVVLLSVLFTGCTTYSISNPSLLQPIVVNSQNAAPNLVTFPIHVEASPSAHDCSSSRSGRITRTRCTNKSRLERISDNFKDRGYRAVLGNQSSQPSILITEEDEGFFIRMGSDLANILSLGFIPKFRYDDVTITYTDPKKDILVTKKLRISKAKSWFHLFMSNPDNMEGSWFARAERNLLSSVLDEADVITKK